MRAYTPSLAGIHAFPQGRKWRAKWIQSPTQHSDRNCYFLFRRNFVVEEALAERFQLFITGETRFNLYLDGHRVGRGVPPSQPWHSFYEAFDIEFEPGEHTMAVLLYFNGFHEAGRPGLLAEMTYAGEVCLETDESWKVLPANAWRADSHAFRMNYFYTYQEHFDGRKLPPDWNQPGFADRDWPNAAIIRGRHSDRPPAVAPWCRLIPRNLPPMDEPETPPARVATVEECLDVVNRTRSEDLSIQLSQAGRPVDAVTVENVEGLLSGETALFADATPTAERPYDGRWNPAVLLDFGKIINARIRFTAKGNADAHIALGYAERLVDGQFNNAIEGPFADSFTLREGEHSYETFHWKAFRYLKIRLSRTRGLLQLSHFTAVESRYPFQERGCFASANDELNQIWEISRETIRLCSNEFLMDTPSRETAQWLGDVAAVTLGGIYACFGDTALPGKFIRQSAANQYPAGLLSNISNAIPAGVNSTIPDYSLHWIIGLWDHYEYSGETRWIDEFYPVALRIFQFFEAYVNEEAFLEELPLGTLVDWANVEKHGECAPINAIFYGALGALERMANYKHDVYFAEKFALIGSILRGNFHEAFFDPEMGCYADARVDRKLSKGRSEHASLAAICFGLVEDDIAADIVTRAYEERTLQFPVEAQPFFTTFVLQALDKVGRFDLAIQLIHDRWGRRMIDRAATSTFEEWSENGTWRSGSFHGMFRTHSHAWSAHPAEFLVRNLIGLEIVAPGCQQIRIDPKDLGSDYRVRFPTPLGDVEVEWRNGALNIEAAEGIEVLA